MFSVTCTEQEFIQHANKPGKKRATENTVLRHRASKLKHPENNLVTHLIIKKILSFDWCFYRKSWPNECGHELMRSTPTQTAYIWTY